MGRSRQIGKESLLNSSSYFRFVFDDLNLNVWHARAKDLQDFYVAVIRTRDEATIVTDSLPDVREQVQHPQENSSAIYYSQDSEWWDLVDVA